MIKKVIGWIMILPVFIISSILAYEILSIFFGTLVSLGSWENWFFELCNFTKEVSSNHGIVRVIFWIFSIPAGFVATVLFAESMGVIND